MSLLENMLAKILAPVGGVVLKAQKVYPSMVTSPDEVITAHNSSVKTRQVVRAKKRTDAKLGK